jgi:hypothetical protein
LALKDIGLIWISRKERLLQLLAFNQYGITFVEFSFSNCW